MSGGFDAFVAVRDAVAVVCEVNPGTLTVTTSFAELGADSLARVSIADVVEATVRNETKRTIRIDDAALGAAASLQDLVALVSAW